MTNIIIDPYKFGGTPDATVTFTDESVNNANLTTYDFTSQALGSGTTADYIIVAIVAETLAARDLSSVTVDGQAATIVIGQNNIPLALDGICAIAIAPATANSTGTISVTFTGAMVRCGIGVWRAKNLLSATPTDTGSDTGASPSDTLNISAGGIAVGVVKTTTADTTWTGLTERYDTVVEVTSHCGADAAFASAQAGLTISTDSSAGSVAMALASFR